MQRTCDEIRGEGGVAVQLLGTFRRRRRRHGGGGGRRGPQRLERNNAGIDAEDWNPVHEWDVDRFDQILATNPRGPFLVASATIPHRRTSPEFLHFLSDYGEVLRDAATTCKRTTGLEPATFSLGSPLHSLPTASPACRAAPRPAGRRWTPGHRCRRDFVDRHRRSNHDRRGQ